MWLLALGLFACACVALATGNALAANAVTPVISPSVGTGSTVFRITFRAGQSVNAGLGTYYRVRVKTSPGAGCKSQEVDYEVMASRREQLTFSFRVGRRQWCGGRWSGAVYFVRDRTLIGGCSGSGCVTRKRVGKFSFRVKH